MEQPPQDHPRRSLNIGLVAYGVTPGLVMVRVPTERGRWVLTERCVVEVDCRCCGAVAGEPCRRNWHEQKRRPSTPIKHGSGTHAVRRDDGKRKYGHAGRLPQHKLRIGADDLAAIQAGADG